MLYFTLDAVTGNPIPYEGTNFIEVWEDLREQKIIKQMQVCKGVWVSCIFTGVSMTCFEVAIFGGKMANFKTVHETREAALIQFEKSVKAVADSEGLTALESMKKKRKNAEWAF